MTEASPTPEQIKRWRRYLAEERMEQKTYLDLANRRTGEEAEILRQLAAAESRHEQYWESLLGEHAEPAPKPALSSRILAGFARLFGSIFVLALAQRAGSVKPDVDSDDRRDGRGRTHPRRSRARACSTISCPHGRNISRCGVRR